MKVCPQCNQQYEDSMFFCLEDGTPLKSNDNSVQTNPVSFEQTLQMPADEKTLNLPASNESAGEKTLVLPSDAVTENKSVPTKVIESETMPPQPLPVTAAINENAVLTNYTESNEKRGNGLFIIAGVLLGGIALIGTAIGGWFFLRDSSNEVVFTNTANKQNQSSNGNNSVLSNGINSVSFGENNSNVSNLNSNVAVNTNSNKPTPKPSPTQDKKDSPTPTQTPEPTATPKTPTPEPTPTPTAAPTRKPPGVISRGVLNGSAVNLVRPPYPPAAKAVRASGTVNVQVLIDESGNVVRASALSGHALLKGAAVQAALASKFSPASVGGQPVKVTGIIVYNFVP